MKVFLLQISFLLLFPIPLLRAQWGSEKKGLERKCLTEDHALDGHDTVVVLEVPSLEQCVKLCFQDPPKDLGYQCKSANYYRYDDFNECGLSKATKEEYPLDFYKASDHDLNCTYVGCNPFQDKTEGTVTPPPPTAPTTPVYIKTTTLKPTTTTKRYVPSSTTTKKYVPPTTTKKYIPKTTTKKYVPKTTTKKYIPPTTTTRKTTIKTTPYKPSTPKPTPYKPPTTKGPRTDSHARCCEWAGEGECTRNANWMKVHCSVSCGTSLCTVEGGPYCPASVDINCQTITMTMKTRGTRYVTTPQPVPNCFDFNSSCPEWAGKGDCDSNPHWMKPNCQKSCQTCGSSLESIGRRQIGNCVDGNNLCGYWADTGECSSNWKYMSANCPASCGAC